MKRYPNVYSQKEDNRMIPTNISISGGSLQALAFYIAILGVLLFASSLLRLKIPLLKRCFIPASLLAGLIGLLLGPHCIGIVPVNMVKTWAALPTRLIEVIFAAMLIGVNTPNLKKSFVRAGPQIAFAYSSSFFQIGLTSLLTAFLLSPLFGVSNIFGSIIEVGFAGGHGTAGGMKEIYASLKWPEGGDLGLTTATFGLFVGIFGGIAIINYSVRKGYTSVLTTADAATQTKEIFTGEEKKPNAYATVSTDVIESFALHLSLIGIALLIGQAMVYGFRTYAGLRLPLFPLAMIGGLILQKILAKTFVAELIDRRTLVRIQGMCLEFLVVSAIASISLPVIWDYFAPLMISTIFITVFIVAFFFYVGKRLFKDEWFEHSIIRFGTTTGVAAVGLMLLRTADPEMKTMAGETFAIGSPIISPFIGGGFITASVPVLLATYGAATVGAAFTAGAFGVLLLARLAGWWHEPSPNAAPAAQQDLETGAQQ